MAKGRIIPFQASNYKKKVMLLEEFSTSNLGISVYELIKKIYSGEKENLFTNILKDMLTVENVIFLNKELGELKHLRDRRSPEEYACDLVIGWLIEDIILEILISLGYQPELRSADRNREFLKRPSASADIELLKNGQKLALIETVKDFTGFWKKNRVCHLRDNKYNNLLDENGILLGLDFLDKDFFASWVHSIDAKKIDSHFRYGGKGVFELNLDEVEFYPLVKLKIQLEKLLELP